MNDLTPLNMPEYVPDAWSHIDTDDVDRASLLALRAKPATDGRSKAWQAGIRVSAGRWRWSRVLYQSSAEAEAEAVKKVNELKGK